ncbi:leucyl aminopeptidase [Marichromatium gracile]|uniref:Probable cytosol aminopeptidase n=1 Tax=Marichromatium gracile TaxID=1048 RepID=A0A4R4AGX6_MARGR|nr:leucyl aminopeptidase [Marichromatium gracile]MBK1708333.1 leucyl aminopeptidase [Marichromatium gracile]TCW38538.1 leucyl aminopeptidase [Marichromatium gracile]
MEFKIKTGDLAKQKTPCLVLGVFEKHRLGAPAEAVDKACDGQLTALLKKGDMSGENGRTLLLYGLPGVAAERVLLVGCGKRKEFDRAAQRKAVTAAVDALAQLNAGEALCTLAEPLPREADRYLALRDIVVAAAARDYRYSRTKDTDKLPKVTLKRLALWVEKKAQQTEAEQAIAHGRAIGDGVALARELGNLPGNICTPSYLAEQAETLAADHPKLTTEILDEAAMAELGMGALLSVSRGSRQPAKLIVMHYRGGAEDAKPVVLVGKGLTFDAGGISLKPAAQMDEMKYDMCGGASVFGALQAACALGLPINLIGVVPASENLPDGAANKPGDIVTSMSGQTIEILNTDAEGRLILCDALTYSKRFDPELVIDLATLTGACVIALGAHASGLFTADDALAEEILGAGDRAGDRAWRMPLWDDYQPQLDSNFADMTNVGGREGGAITAACFLSRFTKDYRWAHIDIAGTAWLGGKEKGGTGRPVALLTELLLTRAGVAPKAG